MQKFFFFLVITFGILFVTNIIWIVLNLYFWATAGIDIVLSGSEKGLFQNIYYSLYFKWIVFADVLWIISSVIFMLKRKHFKTDPTQHFLKYNPMNSPRICVTIAAYNEHDSIGQTVKDFIEHRYVQSVIVVDNKSTDDTASLAEKHGAKVIRQDKNRGYAHSYAIGLKEALKTDTDIIAIADADGTINAYDLDKMIPYLVNCDTVVGTRQVQIFTQKGNQNSIMHVWGNYWLAKLIQFKYFSLHHFGIINLSDVGCIFRVIKKESLEKLSDQLIDQKTGGAIGGLAFFLYLTMKSIEKDLRIVEIPLTFNKRIGKSKTRSDEKITGIKYGLIFLKFILLY